MIIKINTDINDEKIKIDDDWCYSKCYNLNP